MKWSDKISAKHNGTAGFAFLHKERITSIIDGKGSKSIKIVAEKKEPKLNLRSEHETMPDCKQSTEPLIARPFNSQFAFVAKRFQSL